MAVFLDFLDATELKAAAEEKRRVRAATNFIVVDFDLSCGYLQGANYENMEEVGMKLLSPYWLVSISFELSSPTRSR
jgi:hypothetical protein